jgi:excisionase family DNA binding protein
VIKLLTVDEVAEQLHISASQVYTIKAQINYAKLGGAVRFRQQDVDRYVLENMVGPQVPETTKPYKCKCLRRY